jgi:hypothetical protein
MKISSYSRRTAALGCPDERSSAALNEFFGTALLALGVQQLRQFVAECL